MSKHLHSPPQVLADLLGRLERLGQGLPAVLSRREDDFLALGAGLMEFRGSIRRMAKDAEGLDGLCRDDSALAAFDGLRGSLEGLPGAEAQADTDARLAELAAKARQLDAGCRDFLRVVRGLHFLGVATRVESARLGQAGLNFVNLATDVEALVERIRLALERILSGTAATVASVESARIRAGRMRQALATDMAHAREALAQGLDKLLALHRESARLAAGIRGLSGDIAADVEKTMGAVQFHDIVRQQLEHVAEALAEVRQALDAARAQGADEAALAAGLAEFLALQQRQLGQSAGFFGQAGEDLAQGLANISHRLETLQQDLGSFTGLGGGLEMAAQVQERLERTGRMADQAARSRQEGAALLAQLGGTVQAMHVHLQDVETIGTEIKLIALNASIKAAGAGAEGRALAAIAGEIQALSGGSERLAHSVRRSLQDITASAGDLGQAAPEDPEAQARPHAAGVCAMGPEAQALAAAVQAAGRGGAGAIAASLKRLRVRAEVGRELAAAMEELARLAREARSLAPEGVASAELLAGLVSRYTMESERQVHRQHLGQHCPEKADCPTGGELDDNIELF